MSVNKNQYKEMYTAEMPRSKIGKDCAVAFAVGGAICVLGQLSKDLLLLIKGMDQDTAGLLASVVLIVLSALFTGFGLYDKIARHAGAGTLVPITGFANSVVAPAVEFKSEGFILGTGAKMFIIAGPVIVYGTAASIIVGLIFLLIK